MMLTKTCPACITEKPISAFPKSSQAKDGLYTYCRSCSTKKTKENLSKPPRRTPPDGMKWCGGCKQDLPYLSFYKMAGTYDGLSRSCSTCAKKRHAEWRSKNREHANAYHRARAMEYERKKRYGMERGEYDRMLAKQDGKCAVCFTSDPAPRKHFAVDHCHETGKVRGLLCARCNILFGEAEDRPSILQAAMAYLQSHH